MEINLLENEKMQVSNSYEKDKILFENKMKFI